MGNKTHYLVVDAGNTRLKIALFQEDELLQLTHFSPHEFESLTDFINKQQIDFSIFSSVLNDAESQKIKSILPNVLLFSEATIPIENLYETPLSLGSDRLANAVASISKTSGNRLVIDIGTCIKFDLVDEQNRYLGGSISPGIQLRYKALNDFTGKLPLLSQTDKTNLLGKTTNDCIQSGVLNGIQAELDGFISQYEEKYAGLTIFVTGGDHLNFDYSQKNNIFADENLTIYGLLQILKANVQ